MAEDRDQVISVIRACVLSFKGEITPHNLSNDYYKMNGSRIPHRGLGYETLEDFLSSISDVTVSRSDKGALVVTCKPTTNTEHIVRLVAAQRNPKKLTGYNTEYKPYMNVSKPFNSYVIPKESTYIGRNYDPSYRAKFAVRRTIAVTYIHRPSERGDTGDYVVQTDRGERLPRPSGEKKNCYNPFSFQSNLRTGINTHSRDEDAKPAAVRAPKKREVVIPEDVGTWSDGRPAVPVSVPPPQEEYQESYTHTVEDEVFCKLFPKQVNKNKKVSTVLDDKPETGLTPSQLSIQEYREQLLSKESATLLDSSETLALQKSASQVLLGPLPERTDATQPHNRMRGAELEALRDYMSTINMGEPSVHVHLHASGSGYVCAIVAWLFTFESDDVAGRTRSWSVDKAAATALATLHRMSLPREQNYAQPIYIVNRLMAIVYTHTAGIWKHCITDIYISRYEESLSPYWDEMFLMKTQGVAITVIASRSMKMDIWKPKLVMTVRVPRFTSNAATPQEIPVRPIARESLMHRPHTQQVGPNSLSLVSHISKAVGDSVDAWNVVVVNVLATDQVWIRRTEQVFDAIYNGMCSDMDTHYLHVDKGQVSPVIGKLYAINVDRCWRRVKLMNLEPAGNMATLFFIDQGEEDKHNFKMCRHLDEAFTKIPPLAMLCVLTGMKVLGDTSSHLPLLLKSLFGKTFTAYAEVLVENGAEKLHVSLHSIDARGSMNMNYWLSEKMCRTAPVPSLPSVNEIVEAYVSHVTAERRYQNLPLSSPLACLPDCYRRQLPYPILPALGVEFDVHISLVSSPSYFFVQSWLQSAALEQLMSNLQKFYNASDVHEPVNFCNVRPKFSFALSNSDGFWYRIVVRELASEEQALVYLCDFGDVVVVPCSALRILDESFLTLPMQAIKAQLHGVRPVAQEWSLEDCSRFQKLLTARDFVSYIQKATPDADHSSEMIVSLDLVDLGPGYDLHINKLLVLENRAVFYENEY